MIKLTGIIKQKQYSLVIILWVISTAALSLKIFGVKNPLHSHSFCGLPPQMHLISRNQYVQTARRYKMFVLKIITYLNCVNHQIALKICYNSKFFSNNLDNRKRRKTVFTFYWLEYTHLEEHFETLASESLHYSINIHITLCSFHTNSNCT